MCWNKILELSSFHIHKLATLLGNAKGKSQKSKLLLVLRYSGRKLKNETTNNRKIVGVTLALRVCSYI